jgi:class 3 adenylate cyclase/DNA-binding SARP family transcriptional activator/tetratricopeptide (TPR) repeat protein
VRVGLLGPLSVVDDSGIEVRVPAAKERAVLSWLALRAGSNVRSSDLTAALWGDDPPPTAAKTLQNYVAALRRVLPAGSIATVPGGYRLAVEPDDTDVARFERLARDGHRTLEQGDPVMAADLLEGALSMWRGDPLVDLADEAPGLSEATRLAELRKAVEEELTDARLAHGEDALLVADLEAAAAEEPLRERRWGQLMLALYRSGRQADALRAYQRLRTVLGDELGLEPSDEIRNLEAAIVAQDAKLAAVNPPDPRPGSTRRVTAGRESVLDRRSDLDGAAQHSGGAETVTVTVLFTDLVGSTELADRLGLDEADDLRREHFRLLRDAVSTHGGTEVKSLGDGVMVVFSSVRAALDGAIAMQRAIARRNRRRDVPIAIRIGISTGDTTLDEGDYFGPPVIEAARLCSAASGGEILTTELVRLHATRTGHRFDSVGELDLKGLAESVPSAALHWASADIAPLVPLPRRLLLEGESPFVGRAVEKSRMMATFKSVAAGEGRRLVMLSGEAGMGKTMLAAEVARSAHETGASVLYGRCDEELAVPYQPFAEALRHYIAHAPPGALRAHVGRHRDTLSRIVPDLAAPDLSQAPKTTDPDAERLLLYEAVQNVLASAAAETPIILVLEDLHWADPATILLLRHLMAASEDLPLLILTTFRSDDLRRHHSMAEFRAAMHREPDIVNVHLSGLDESEIVDLLKTAGDDRLDGRELELAHALRRQTDGNPFFTAEILRHLAEVGTIQGEPTTMGASPEPLAAGLPVSIRDVVRKRVAHLGGRADQILRMAAVMGREFDVDVISTVTEVSEEEIVDVLDQACDAALVTEVGGAGLRYGFCHILTQLALYEDQSAARRRLGHRRIAETIEATCGSELGPRSGELALHWLAASGSAEVDKPIEYCTRAGDAAKEALAFDTAVRWYTDALQLLDRKAEPDEGTRVRLMIGLGEAQRGAGDPAHRETLLRAAHLAHQLSDTASLVRAVLATFRGWHSIPGHVDVEKVDAIEMALASVGPSDTPERVRLLKQLAAESSYAGDYDRCQDLDKEAVAMARRLGDPATLLHALVCGQSGYWGPETQDRRLAASREAVVLADQVGDLDLGSFAYNDLALAAYAAGEIEESEQAARKGFELTQRCGTPSNRWRVKVIQGARTLLRGDVDGAETLAEEALQMGRDSGQRDALISYVICLSAVRWHQGRPNELIPTLEKASSEYSAKQGFLGILARAYLDVGNEAGARAVLDRGRETEFNPPWDVDWLVTVAMFADSASRLGDREAARLMYGRLLPWHDRAILIGAMGDSCVAHYLGTLAAILGDFDNAEAHFNEALDIHRATRVPFHLARTRLAWGRMLVGRSSPGDASRAEALLTEAAETARSRRYGLLLGEAEQLLT